MNPIFDGRAVRGAIALALGLAIMGTVLGARLHSTRGFSGEGGEPVYAEYGWPWGWKTNAPEWLIEQANDNPSGSALADLTAWPEHGTRICVFLGITTMWFVAALTVESVLWWLGRRLLRLWPRSTAGAGSSAL